MTIWKGIIYLTPSAEKGSYLHRNCQKLNAMDESSAPNSALPRGSLVWLVPEVLPVRLGPLLVLSEKKGLATESHDLKLKLALLDHHLPPWWSRLLRCLFLSLPPI